jgi:hypothetical protein
MAPPDFANFFLASAGAGAALIGLLFVAISIAPERTVQREAPVERRAVAGSAFTALVNAFFISLGGLIPGASLGGIVLTMSTLALVNSARLGWTLRRGQPGALAAVRRLTLLVVSLVVYGLEWWYALQLQRAPADSSLVYTLAWLVLTVYGIGLTRAWELLGASRGGLTDWLSPLHNLEADGAGRGASAAPPTASRATGRAGPDQPADVADQQRGTE